MKTYFVQIILFPVLLISGIQISYSSSVEIELKKQVALTDSRYSLSEIAEVRSVNIPLLKKLSDLEIGKSPRPNYVGLVTRSNIASRLESAYPGVNKNITWLGEDIVKVKSVGVTYSGKRLTKVAEAFVIQWLGQKYNDFEVKVVAPVKDALLPVGDTKVVPKLVAEGNLKSRLSIWLDIYVDGSIFRTLPVWVSIIVFDDALVAK